MNIVTRTPRSGATPLAAQPAPPSRLYSFTGWQASNPTAPPPGDRMDADYDNTNTALTQTLPKAATSLNTDGTLKAGSVGQSQMVSGLFDDIAQDIIAEVQPLVDQANGSAASALAASTPAQSSATAADRSNTAAAGAATTATAAADTATAAQSAAQGYAGTAQAAATNASNADNHATGEAALAQDYADVTQAWAEHMPDTIPPNILAVMGVTGSHWSSRWWANQAGINARGGGAYVGAAPPGDTLAPLWWDNASGQLFIQYSDGNSTQWVSANSVTADQLQAAIGSVNVANVLDYGAKGDGTTDDTAAIQAVLNAYAGKATVFIPWTPTSLQDQQADDTGQHHSLLLHGKLFALSGLVSGYIDIINVSNVSIEGYGSIDANGPAQTAVGGMAGMAVANSTNIRSVGHRNNERLPLEYERHPEQQCRVLWRYHHHQRRRG